jgi:Tol biopolymer transport system component
MAQPASGLFSCQSFMKFFSRIVMLASGIVLITHVLRAEDQTNALPTIPTGKLAFVTAKNFGYAGKIDLMAGQRRGTMLAYDTREMEFLPDGEHIIYCADATNAHGIYIYDLRQQVSLPLLTNILNAEGPSWSPDGTKVAFEVWTDGRKSSQIWIANVDGSGAKQLTDGDYYNWTPRWSPDGRKLVLETTRNDNPTNHVKNGGYRDIYVMDSDGQNQVNLTTNTFGHHPMWSPDGKFIAY